MSSASAQEAPQWTPLGIQQSDRIAVSVYNALPTKKGDALVLCIRIYCTSDAGFELGKANKKDPENPILFSLAKACLVDPATAKRYDPAQLPIAPFFGSSETFMEMQKGDWVQLGTAFPMPPAPAPAPDGSIPAQRLLLHVPLPIKPIEFVFQRKTPAPNGAAQVQR